MRIGELRKQFVEVFREEMEKDGFFPYKGTFFKVDLENKWMMYVTIGTMAGGYVFRNCFQVVPFTYGFHESAEDLKDEISHDFCDVERVLHPGAPRQDFFTFKAESMPTALQIYKRDIRKLMQNVHTFSDSVIRSEEVRRFLYGYVQLNSWLHIITHAYLHDFSALDEIFQEWMANLKDNLLRGEEDLLRAKEELHSRQKEIEAGNLKLTKHLKHSLDNCNFSVASSERYVEHTRDRIAQVENLYALYNKKDYTIFIEAAEKNIQVSEENAKRIVILAEKYNKRYG